MPMLRVDNLWVAYGEISALKGVSLEVHPGQIVSLIGANGAGKTTLLKTISGLLRPQQGDIVYGEHHLNKIPPYEMIALGVVQVPEGRRIFADMTVEENLEMGAYFRRDKQGIADSFAWVYDLFPRLADRRKQVAGTMSGGEQQMLAVGRALMADPKVLMLDEPSMGLAPLVVGNLFEKIKEINSQGTTILLVEQNAYLSLQMADHGYVLETGRIVLAGPGPELLNDDRVRKVYLGED